MQKTIIIYIAILISFNASAQLKSQNRQFILKGKIIGQEYGYLTLSYTNKYNKQVKESCLLQNGNFYFTGQIKEPTLAIFKGAIKSISDDDPNSTTFYLEPGIMNATVKVNQFKEIIITGSKTQKENELLQKEYDAIDIRSDSAYEKFSNLSYQFISSHLDSYLSAFQLSLYETRWPLDSVINLYNELNPKIQKSFYGLAVAESIHEVENNSAGKMAKPFTAVDLNGQSISLSDFHGRYVLIDFWASWCVPCRQGNPHLIELFKKYHDKGLNIIGASDDYNIEAWKTAVKKDKVGIWYNILSENKMNSNTEKIKVSQSISKKFGIHVLPTKILIDKNGMIVGRYKGTEQEPELDKKLSEIFR